jgi:hypothetical protein
MKCQHMIQNLKSTRQRNNACLISIHPLSYTEACLGGRSCLSIGGNKRHVFKDAVNGCNKYCSTPDPLQHPLSSFLLLPSVSLICSPNTCFAGRKRKDNNRIHLIRQENPFEHPAFYTNHPAKRNQNVNTGQKRPTRRSHRAPKTPPRTSCTFTHWLPTPRFPSHTVGLPLAQ